MEGFRGEPAVEGLVAPVQLGVGLLQQGRPELGGVRGVEVDEAALVCRQTIVDQNLNPVSKIPESEPAARVTNWFAELVASSLSPEDATVAMLEVLVRRDHPVQEPEERDGL